MRKLVYFSLGLAAACGLWAYGAGVYWYIGLGILLVLALFFLGWKKTVFLVAGIALGAGLCGLHSRLFLDAALAMDGEITQARLHICEYSAETPYGIQTEGLLQAEGKTYRIQLYLDGETPVAPGMTVTGTFRFRATGPDAQEPRSYQSGKGIQLIAYQRGEAEYAQDKRQIWDYPAIARRTMKEILEKAFPEDTQAFARALLLGDTQGLDYETDTALKISGIRHIVAVSGLHVSIFFGALEVLTLRRRYLTALVGFPALLAFAAVMGFSPSVSRACLMVGLMLLARLLNREYDGPSALAFAAAAILGVNPASAASVSFQMSVASVAGIFLFQPGIQKWLLAQFGVLKPKTLKTRLARWFSSSVSVSLSATILTTPLSAWYFGTVSLVSVLTNLLTLWMVSLVFTGLCIAGLAGLIFPGLASVLGWCLSWGIRYVLLVARTLAAFPLAAVYTTSPYIVAWLVFVYGLLAVFLLSRNRRPLILGCCAIMGLCLALVFSWLEVKPGQTRITVLDVGQGQCILLQAEGRSFLVDCGGDSDTAAAELAAQTLLGQGIHKLDGLILTHCDRDHAGGAEYLMTRLDMELLIQPENGNIRADTRVVYASSDLELTVGSAVLRIFAPTFPGDSNERSLCVLFDTEKCDILITGDRSGFGERSLLRSGNLEQVDVLIAGHHGSKNATCEELLEAIQPEIVCISAGLDNPYGHPAPETLERLAKFGCRVYRTDQVGTITIRR